MQDELDELEFSDAPAPVVEVIPFDTFWSEYSKACSHIDGEVRTKVKENRARRRNLIDVEKARQSGFIDKDETFIPVRVIDMNVRREIVPYMRYLIQAARVAIFKDTATSESNFEAEERYFTDKFKYKGWIIPFFRCVYASTLHGYSALEVSYDDTAPGKFSFYFVSPDDFIIPKGVTRLEASPFVGIRLTLSWIEFEKLTKIPGMDQTIAARVLDDRKDCKHKNFEVHKLYIKQDGIVYLAFVFKENGGASDKWLLAPRPLNQGVMFQVMVPGPLVIDPMSGMPMQGPSTTRWEAEKETEYPVFDLPYQLTDDVNVLDNEGRGTLDEAAQEAQSAILSSYINQTNRAAKMYLARDKGNPEQELTMLDLKLEAGRPISDKVSFFSTPNPSPDMLRALSFMDTKGQEEIGQISFAANNRVDSRKTAKEVVSAEGAKNELDSVTVLLFSSWLAGILNYTWRITKSAAMQQAIVFPQDNLARPFQLLPAGDVDVIQKQEKLNNRYKVWPLVSAIPQLAQPCLLDILKELFPLDAARYEQAMQQAQPNPQLIQGLVQMCEGLLEASQDPQKEQIMQQLQQIKATL